MKKKQTQEKAMMNLRILILYLLIKANISNYIYCSATTATINQRNRNQIFDYQSIKDFITSSQLRINSERSFASDSRGQLLRLEDPLKSKQEPRWTNPCNKHSLNNTLIRIIIDPQNYYPSQIIESERKERGRFLREALMNLRKHNLSLMNQADLSVATLSVASAVVADSSTGRELTERTKRSIISVKKVSKDDFRGLTTSGNSLNEFAQNEKSGILLKKPKMGAKKTTFSTIDKSYSKNRIKSREYHSLPLDSQLPLKYNSNTQNMHTQLLPTTTPSRITNREANITSTTPTFNPNIQKETSIKGSTLSIKVLQTNGIEVDELLKRIFADDIKIYWYLNRASNTLNKVKRIARNIKRLIEDDLRDKNIKEKRYEEILEQRDWLPNLEHLIKTNQLNQHSESRQILANISHYIQFFSCAFEQMVYEQVTLDKKFTNAYRELEKATLRILCDIDTLIIYLEKFNYNKTEYLNEIRIITSQSSNTSEEKATITQRNSISNEITRIDKNNSNSANKDSLNQPSFKAGDSLALPPQQVAGGETKNLNMPKKRDLTSFSPVGNPAVKREVMPRNQRSLNSSLERTVRDQSILIEFEKVLTYYNSLLSNVYI